MRDRVPRCELFGKPMRWGRLYARHCPHRTDPTSRHVKVIAQNLRDLRSPLRNAVADWGPDHMAESLEMTVKMLWEAREEIERLRAELQRLRDDREEDDHLRGGAI